MFEKIMDYIIEKVVPLALICSFFTTTGVTVFEVKYFQLTNSEEIVLYFFFTFLFVIFIFLIIAKIIKLSNEINTTPIHEHPQIEEK